MINYSVVSGFVVLRDNREVVDWYPNEEDAYIVAEDLEQTHLEEAKEVS